MIVAICPTHIPLWSEELIYERPVDLQGVYYDDTNHVHDGWEKFRGSWRRTFSKVSKHRKGRGIGSTRKPSSNRKKGK